MMFADLLMPEVQARLSTVTVLLIEKGVFTPEEFESRLEEITKILHDPEAMRRIAEERAKRHASTPP